MRVVSDETFAAITIRAEAEGEPHEGKVAVGEVIRRRMRERFFSDGTVVGTCFRRLQFSIWNDDLQDNTRAIKMLHSDDADPVYVDCLLAWRESNDSGLVPGAVQYFNPAVVMPSWLPAFVHVRTIGNHDFLRRRP